MGILSWILMGLIAGSVAKMLNPGKDPGGWIITILIGIAGAFVGGAIGRFALDWDVTGFNPKSMALAIFGSFLLLFVYSRFIKKP